MSNRGGSCVRCTANAGTLPGCSRRRGPLSAQVGIDRVEHPAPDEAVLTLYGRILGSRLPVRLALGAHSFASFNTARLRT
jgi:hypothetical protein